MTYEERVKALAEEMARDFYGAATIKNCDPIDRRKIMSRYCKAARIAVKHMADVFIEAYCGPCPDESERAVWVSDATLEAIERGLIPSDKKTIK